MRPLEDYLVIDFSQFLSGPSASLKLADMGARVIKIEKPGTGDICRHLYTSTVIMNGESSVFHAINRNKQRFAADMKALKNATRLLSTAKYQAMATRDPGKINRGRIYYCNRSQV